jgi:hypothetical protein
VQTITAPAAVTATINAAALANNAVTLAGNAAYVVTGLGTVAGPATVTEGATHTTGSLTVTTAGTNAVTITGIAAGTGTMTINHAGTQTATIATGGHAVVNVISSDANTTTISGAGNLNFSTSGTAGAKTVTSTTTGAAGDTVIGSSGVDTVTLGVGADFFTTGGGADVFNLAPTTDTGIALGFVFGAAVPANGATINVSGLDKITGFGTGVTIVTGLTETGAIARNGQALGAGGNTANALDAAMIVGTYDAVTGIFTVSAAGNSTLFVYDDNGNADGGNLRGVVLVGYVDLSGNDTYNGTLTGVGG